MAKALEFCEDFDRYADDESFWTGSMQSQYFRIPFADVSHGSRMLRVRSLAQPTNAGDVPPGKTKFAHVGGNDDGFTCRIKSLSNVQAFYFGTLLNYKSTTATVPDRHLIEDMAVGSWGYFGWNIDLTGTFTVRTPTGAIVAAVGQSFPINREEWFQFELLGYLDGLGNLKYRVWINDIPLFAEQTITAGAMTKFDSFQFEGDDMLVYIADPFLFVADDIADLTEADRLGNVRINHLGKPNGPGSLSEFTGSDGNSVDNHLLVDAPNTTLALTEYVADVGPAKESFDMPTVDLTGRDVRLVAAQALTTLDGVAEKSTRFFQKEGINEDPGVTFTQTPNLDWRTEIFETAPDGTAWDAAHVDALELGVEVL